MKEDKTCKKRFSIKLKMFFSLGLPTLATLILLGLYTIGRARSAVMESVKAHLFDKAEATAALIDSRIQNRFTYLEGIARTPELTDKNLTMREKAVFLEHEAEKTPWMKMLAIVDLDGNYYKADGTTQNLSHLWWFSTRKQFKFKRFYSKPFVSAVNGNFILVVSVPIYDSFGREQAVLAASIDGFTLSDGVSDIKVGETGACYMTDSDEGVVLAYKDKDMVRSQFNILEAAKTDPSMKELGEYIKRQIETHNTEIGYYNFKGKPYIACSAVTKTTLWNVIVHAPVNEFLWMIDKLRTGFIILIMVLVAIAFSSIFIVSNSVVKPVRNTVSILHEISQGDGDLTVRLPVTGNDELTDLQLYFNQTIEKIEKTIKGITSNSAVMKTIGNELADNMNNTSIEVHAIGENIEIVKEQAVSQSASVTETSATMEEIIRTIKNLNRSIETQAASVAQSSASIEQMAQNIASITQTLDKADDSIQSLAEATADGKETVIASNSVTQKISEGSASLMEASSVIQNIAEQTNLLAMNAAIEAAHAGEAGKGFAVVADEIRKLAEESSSQGQQITSTLKNLWGEIESLSSSSKTVEEKFNAIFSLSNEVKTISASLTQAMKEQENGSREVLAAIKNINSVTSEVKDGSAEMLRGGEQVAGEMHKLDGLTRSISESMNEMASGAEQITSAIKAVNEMSEMNREAIDELNGEVKKFKVSNETSGTNVDFDSVMQKHASFKAKLNEAIENKQTIDAQRLSKDNVCDFGMWLYSAEMKKFKGNSNYEMVIGKHAEFHKEAGKIAFKINEGKYDEASSMLKDGTPFARASSSINVAIQSLRNDALRL